MCYGEEDTSNRHSSERTCKINGHPAVMDFHATSAHLRIARPAGTEAQLTEPDSGSQKL